MKFGWVLCLALAAPAQAFDLQLSAAPVGDGMNVMATLSTGVGPYQVLFDCGYLGGGVYNWDYVVNTDSPPLLDPLRVTRFCPTLAVVHVAAFDKGAGWSRIDKQIFSVASEPALIGLASPPCSNTVPHEWEIEWADGLIESFNTPIGELFFPERPHWDWRSRTRPTGATLWSDWGRWHPAVPYPGDVTGDTVVDIQDHNILRNNFGNQLP